MNLKELLAFYEQCEVNADKNAPEKFFLSLIARGVWQIAVQIARANHYDRSNE